MRCTKSWRISCVWIQALVFERPPFFLPCMHVHTGPRPAHHPHTSPSCPSSSTGPSPGSPQPCQPHGHPVGAQLPLPEPPAARTPPLTQPEQQQQRRLRGQQGSGGWAKGRAATPAAGAIDGCRPCCPTLKPAGRPGCVHGRTAPLWRRCCRYSTGPAALAVPPLPAGGCVHHTGLLWPLARPTCVARAGGSRCSSGPAAATAAAAASGRAIDQR